MKKIFLLISLILCTIVLSGCQKNVIELDTNYQTNPLFTPEEKIQDSDANEDTSIENTNTTPISDNIYINVPFADQAPLKDWGEPYQEACEETSIIMAHEFVLSNQQDDLDKSYIDGQILNMVSWQQSNWGGHYDLSSRETLDLFRQFYNYQKGAIVAINSIDDIKKILSSGKIIIAPTYGRLLNNPYFTSPGPVYHMLVIKGYNENNFITNDPGIWQGKDFIYPFDNLFNSIHDLPDEATKQSGYVKSHPELMENTLKSVIVIEQ